MFLNGTEIRSVTITQPDQKSYKWSEYIIFLYFYTKQLVDVSAT